MSLHDEAISLCVFESGLQAVAKAAVSSKAELSLVDFYDSSVLSIYKQLQPKVISLVRKIICTLTVLSF